MSSISTSSTSAQETVSSEPSESSENQSTNEASRIGTKRVKNQPSKMTSKKKPSTAVKRTDSESEDETNGNANGEQAKPVYLDNIPVKTQIQNKWGANIWKEWAKKRNSPDYDSTDNIRVPEEVKMCNLQELGHWLPVFVSEVRRHDGTEYPYNSLYQICCAIKRYLNNHVGGEMYNLDIFNRKDETFSNFNNALDNKMEEIASKGLELKAKSADPVTREDEETLWRNGVINTDTAQGLSYAVFFYNCKVFNVIGKDEHWSLSPVQYRFYFDPSAGREVIEFQSRFCKSSDGLKRDRNQTEIRRHLGSPYHPRCVLKIFKKYLSLIPQEGHFYRKPNSPYNDGSITYSIRNIGYNKLRSCLKTMFKLAGIDMTDRKITTYSLKPFDYGGDNKINYQVPISKSDFLLPLDPFINVPKLSPERASNEPGTSRVDISTEVVHVATAHSPKVTTNAEMYHFEQSDDEDDDFEKEMNFNEARGKETGIPKQVKDVIDYVRNTGGGRISLELDEGTITKIQIEL